MDILTSCRQLIKEMVNLAGPQMKLILMDKDTTSCISCAYAQSEIMQKEVYLFDRLDSKVPREPIGHLKCIVFVRPTEENIKLLVQEVRRPKYNQYYIYFANVVQKSDIKRIAEADENEVVREVHEFFMDGVPLRRDLHSLNVTKIYDNHMQISPVCYERIRQGLEALLLQLKKNPAVRYQRSSPTCKRLAEAISQFKRDTILFEQCHSDAVVVIIERSHDALTPLLNQWTYEAMIHELFTITNNRVSIEGQSMVLSELYDDFFTQNIVSNFGEIGQNIKTLIGEFQQKSNVHKNLESISDLKKFVEDYPQFKKISGSVSKHVTLVESLSKVVQSHNLLEISEVEQSIAVEGDHGKCLDRVKALIQQPKTTNLDALRLVMIYALRFENHPYNELSSLLTALRLKEPKASQIVKNLLRYGGNSRRSNNLFGEGLTNQITKKIMKGIKGVENIYTQHEPYLKRIIESIRSRNEQLENYPLVDIDVQRYDNVIIFIVGGATFEEAAFVRSLNDKRSQGLGGPSVILSSNTVLNTKSFIEELLTMGSSSH
ncbi:unnamed protein product [Caenorhabditis bovis]|uniref:Vacuolar protein sorting-associated protein 45 n=1 Tax=Caenorhabditis bovis TaxID=2654633 RepID=A0A8S1FF30_9PELO|nr:unnamed protein product [Caenorhabditis bovis]